MYELESQRQQELCLSELPTEGPLVSVLIRSMDRPQLQDALDAIAVQDYRNIEVIVINACAGKHRALSNLCGQFPLRVESSGIPLMRSQAANAGLDSATGEYLIFLDDDDWFAPTHISTLVEILKANPAKRAAYSGVEFRGENRESLSLSPFDEPFDAGRLRSGNYIPIHAMMFSNTCLTHGARFDEAFLVYEDWDFLLQLAQLTEFVHVPGVRAFYRASGTSGVGVYADSVLKRQAREQIFDKWKLYWSGAQIDDLIKATANLANKSVTALTNRLVETSLTLQGREVELGEIRSDTAELRKNIVGLDNALLNLHKIVREQEQTNAKISREIADLKDQIIEYERAISLRNAHIADLIASTSWRLTLPVRWIGNCSQRINKGISGSAIPIRLWHNLERVRSIITNQLRKQSMLTLAGKALRVWREEGLHGLKAQVLRLESISLRLNESKPNVLRLEWEPLHITRDLTGQYKLAPETQGYTYIEPHPPADIISKIDGISMAIKFSIVVPVYNTVPALLHAVLASIQAQWYPHWQLILADDASPSPETRAALAEINHPNIKLIRLERNQGIAGATNTAIDAADGDFIVFMDHDDELTVDCLYELALCITREQPDFIYSDEDKLSEQGEYVQPHFKPDWSPNTMMSTMFTGHVSCVRRSLLEKVGGLRPEFDGCQDWDFVLRVSENTSLISHVAKVLYHWRILPESVASDIAAKPYVLDASRRVRIDALARRGMKGVVEPIVQVPGYFRINYALQGTPKISIIIPSRDRGEVLRCCIESIQLKTTYRNFEIIVLDNGTVDSTTLDYLQELPSAANIQVIRHDAPFNFSELNNIGARHATGSLLLFLNDDTEVLCSDWLERMGGYAQLPHIAAVGAKLLYPNSKKIQHAGVLNLASGPVHAFLKCYSETPGYFMRNLLEYDWLAVTGACLMIESRKFNLVGGFDVKFPIAYNDVELCFRGVNSGFYNVVCQAVTLIHHESISRGLDHADPVKQARLLLELRRLYEAHPHYFQYDPFHNPNLNPTGLNFEVSN